jgi:hypothetical protein
MMTYESYEVKESNTHPGVRFVVNRMSFGRRIELMRLVRDLAPRWECLQAGTTKPDSMEAGLLSAEIDRLYLQWGLKEVEGLEIDGHPATTETLLRLGPEELLREAIDYVKDACRLSRQATKN